MNRLITLLGAAALAMTACSSPEAPAEAPRVVGVPPQNAYTGLVKLPDGEIRHYGKDHYISSTDQGETWSEVAVDKGQHYGKRNPLTGTYLRLRSGSDDRVIALRSEGGIDGAWEEEVADSNGAIMIKPVVYIRGGKRAIAGFHTKYRKGCGSYYSDDDGRTWKKSNLVEAPHHEATGFHKGMRWNHGAVEPTIVELQDGRLWMIMRTAQDQHYESFSADGGENWSQPQPSRFYATITMPTIQRLANGSLLMLWCNTTPLPEMEHDGGYWEDVFTNRDATHAAISDDDGQSWKGFREIYLNPMRNDSLMATRFGKQGSLDRSVHQSEFVELDEHRVLISLGQHPEFRKLMVLDLNWLRETQTYDDFSEGLAHWSHQNYIKGVQGHCAYNRKPGARLEAHPELEGRQVMHLEAKADSSLLHPASGGVYNFPAAHSGSLSMRVKADKSFDGCTLALHDRWFNPVDTVAHHFAMHKIYLDKALLSSGQWHDLKWEWKQANDSEQGSCVFTVDGKEVGQSTGLQNSSQNGISYLHLGLMLQNDDQNGIYIESIRSGQ